MSPRHLVGIILSLAGVTLLVIGMNASNSLADQWSKFFTGHFTDATVWCIVIGVMAAFSGLTLTLSGTRGSKA